MLFVIAGLVSALYKLARSHPEWPDRKAIFFRRIAALSGGIVLSVALGLIDSPLSEWSGLLVVVSLVVGECLVYAYARDHDLGGTHGPRLLRY